MSSVPSLQVMAARKVPYNFINQLYDLLLWPADVIQIFMDRLGISFMDRFREAGFAPSRLDMRRSRRHLRRWNTSYPASFMNRDRYHIPSQFAWRNYNLMDFRGTGQSYYNLGEANIQD